VLAQKASKRKTHAIGDLPSSTAGQVLSSTFENAHDACPVRPFVVTVEAHATHVVAPAVDANVSATQNAQPVAPIADENFPITH
jgi:hypothetical protein